MSAFGVVRLCVFMLSQKVTRKQTVTQTLSHQHPPGCEEQSPQGHVHAEADCLLSKEEDVGTSSAESMFPPCTT